MLCVMEVEPNLFLNQTGSQFFMKVAKIESFKIPKNWSKDQTRGSPKNKKEVKLRPKVHLKSRTGKHLSSLVSDNHPKLVQTRNLQSSKDQHIDMDK